MLNDKKQMAFASVIAIAVAAPLTTVSGCPELDPADQSGGPDKAAREPDEITLGPPGKDMNYYLCGKELDVCNVGGSRYMAYGAKDHYVFKALRGSTGSILCSAATFGEDPAPGVAKSCYFSNYGTNGDSSSDVLAMEGESAIARASVAYGANGSFYFRTISGRFTCDNATFGNPIPNVKKACYAAVPLFTRVAGEHETMTGLTHNAVAYGAGGGFKYRILSGTTVCDSAAFGGDPAVGLVKDCYKLTDGGLSLTAPVSAPLAYKAYEGDQWTLDTTSSTMLVFYGSGRNGNFTVWTKATDRTTPVLCGNWLHDTDPGHNKHCWATPIARR